MSGPFHGIHFVKNRFGSSLSPKILGTYEREISTTFKNLIQLTNPKYFVDVGCAGGFYCEIAHALNTDTNIIGYDLNSKAISFCQKHLKYGKFYAKPFTMKEYQQFSDDKCLFLMDIEGAEHEFFKSIPVINDNHTFLVEVHDFMHTNENLFDFLTVNGRYDVELICYKGRGSKNKFKLLFNILFLNELRHIDTYYLVVTVMREKQK